MRGISLASGSAQPFRDDFVGALQVGALELVARRRHERAHGVGVARVAQHQPMHARAQDLFDDPVVVLDRHAVEAEHRQRDDDRRRAMAAPGRPAVDEPLHELAQAHRIEGAVLHLVLN
jgi:hypothetical protein